MSYEIKPEKISVAWWRTRFGVSFPDLLAETYESFVSNCIDDVYAMYYGVMDIWDNLPYDVYVDKTNLCYGQLVSWYIADLYPMLTVGVMSTGGLPVKSKDISGVKVTFETNKAKKGSSNNADLLNDLNSNVFGVKAYNMIKKSGKLNFFMGRFR